MFFAYKGKSEKGMFSTGFVEALALKDAANLLRKQGLYILDLRPSYRKDKESRLSFLNTVSFTEIANFTRQLSTMISSGLTLTSALEMLADQTQNKTFQKITEDILTEVQAGNSLSFALKKYNRYFSKIYIASIRAGEAGGLLDQVLLRLADNLDKEREFKSKVKNAMIYPAIIVIGMTAVGFLMMTVVVPQLTSMYRDFGLNLPITTKILIAASDFSVKFWWLMILAVLGSVFFFSKWKKSPGGKRLWDTFYLKLPILGNLQKQIILVEFTRTLSLLISAGLPILEALEIVSDSIDNVIYKDGIIEAAQKVEKGFPLGTPLAQNPHFPVILGQMIKVGEETGKLDESLSKISHYFEFESEQLVKGLTTAIEPIIMVVLGIGVAFLILSIIMPMYQMTNAFQ